MRKILFVINPAAGKGKGIDEIPRIEKAFQGRDYKIVLSKSANSITALVQGELENMYTEVIAVGGDGTLGEVVNGVMGKDIKVGILPVGSGNDFIKALGISENLDQRLEAVKKGRTRAVYVPSVNQHYFINVLGWGVDAEIIKEKNKNFIREGKLNYLYSTIKMLLVYKPKQATFYIDGKEFTREIYLVAIGNGQYVGSGMKICPGGNPEARDFEICIVGKMPLPTLLWHFPKIFKGTHGSVKGIEMLKGREITVSFPKETWIQEDGTLRKVKTLKLRKAEKIQMII